jgi:hypothetical protein
MIRNLSIEDIPKLKEIHEQFYANEFSFDEFLLGSMSNFAITDQEDKEIVMVGSIRPIAEMLAITNKNKSPRVRRDALLESLQIAHYVLRPTAMHQLHVFIQDNEWEKQLIKSGFKKTVGNALYINI